MRAFVLVASIAAAACAGPVCAQAGEEGLRQQFGEAMQLFESGRLPDAEAKLRDLLRATGSPRVKLELARVLYLQGRFDEAKALFQEVANRADTPWRVVDNIAHFVRDIEDRTGYLKFGVTFVSDTNPRSLAAQREFSIGGLRVTPSEAPKKETGLRFSARGWMPSASLGGAGYVTASYTDFPGQEIDRLTVDGGVVKNLVESGNLRAKAGLEFGTFGGQELYRYPYVGIDAVLWQAEGWRLTGEAKTGKVRFADYAYLDATQSSAAMSVRHLHSQNATLSLGGFIERSSAREEPYSYYGWEIGPGIDTFWPGSAFLVGARVTAGARKYEAADPLFGERRVDTRARLEATVGNKAWRWRSSYLSLVGSLERNRSNIEYYTYSKANASIVIE